MELANDISVWYVCVGSVSMGVWRMFDDSPISSGATVYIYIMQIKQCSALLKSYFVIIRQPVFSHPTYYCVIVSLSLKADLPFVLPLPLIVSVQQEKKMKL